MEKKKAEKNGGVCIVKEGKPMITQEIKMIVVAEAANKAAEKRRRKKRIRGWTGR